MKRFTGYLLTRAEMAMIKGGLKVEITCDLGHNRTLTLTCRGNYCRGDDNQGCRCTDYFGQNEDAKNCAVA